jgi:putative transposase
MARKPRIHYPGAIYHVMLRGNAKQTIFHDDEEYRYFENILEQGLDNHSVRLHAYCWMKNHVHMALQVSNKPLAKLMQNISQRYTQWFNKRHDGVGHLFQGRYKAILVDGDAYLLELIRYIHLNPVRAELVTDPGDYQFSSHSIYIGNVKCPEWVTVNLALSRFGRVESFARTSYMHFMGQTVGDDALDPLRYGLGSEEGRILGDEDFIRSVLRQNNEEILIKITIEDLVELVAEYHKILPWELVSASRARHLTKVRAVAALIGVDYCGYFLSDIALYFKRDISSMSRQVSEVRTLMKKKELLRQRVEHLVEQITSISQA